MLQEYVGITSEDHDNWCQTRHQLLVKLSVPNIEACTAPHTHRAPGTRLASDRHMRTLELLECKGLDDLPSFHDDLMFRPAPLD